MFSLAGFGFPKHDFSSPMAKKTESRHFSLSATLLCCLLLAAAAAVGPYVKVYSIAIILFSLYFDWKYVHTKSCMEYGLVRTAYTHAFPCRICSKMWKEKNNNKRISSVLSHSPAHTSNDCVSACMCEARRQQRPDETFYVLAECTSTCICIYIIYIVDECRQNCVRWVSSLCFVYTICAQCERGEYPFGSTFWHTSERHTAAHTHLHNRKIETCVQKQKKREKETLWRKLIGPAVRNEEDE